MFFTFCSGRSTSSPGPDSRAPSVLSVMSSSRSSSKTETWTPGGWHVWAFMVLGILEVILAFLLGVIYFSVRTLTTSLEHIETIPTYANAILVMCSGILVIFLYKRRDPLLLVAAIVLNMVVTILCATSAILTGIRTIHTMQKFSSCRYSQLTYRCYCHVSNSSNFQMETFSAKFAGDLEYVYEGTSSCTVILKNLKDFIYVFCALYSFSTIVCFTMVTIGLLAFQQYRYNCQVVEDMGLTDHMENPAIEDSTSFNFVAYSPPPPPLPPPRAPGPGPPRPGPPGPGPPDLSPHRDISSSSRALFARPMMLPGMGGQPLAQQLGLPGDNHARLIRVNRHNSSAGRGGQEESPRGGDRGRPSRDDNQTTQQLSGTSNRGGSGGETGVRETGEHQRGTRRTSSVPRDEGGSMAVATLRPEDQHGQRHRRRRRPLDATSRQSSFSIYETIVHDRRRRQGQRGNPQRAGVGPRPGYPYPQGGAPRARRQGEVPSHMAFLNLMQAYGGYMGYGGAYPGPSGPPPPYYPGNLPPYIENDPAPSYRSRESTAPPSVASS